MNVRPPTDSANHEHVRIVPVTGASMFFMAVLIEADAGQTAPGIGDVARRAPEIAADFRAPFPDVTISVLAEAVNNIAVSFSERRLHHSIRLLAIRQFGIPGYLSIRAPIVLEVINAPFGVSLRI